MSSLAASAEKPETVHASFSSKTTAHILMALASGVAKAGLVWTADHVGQTSGWLDEWTRKCELCKGECSARKRIF